MDAQASAERVGIAGWLPSDRPDGTLDLLSSRWFSLELRRESWPWVYEKSDNPSLLISTLEARAVLFSLMLFFGDVPPEPRTKVQEAPTWTDNRGNGSALNKLMTSRCPAAVMEMSALLKQRGLQAPVQWAPQTANREADRLANRFTQDFIPAYECVIDPATVQWLIFPRHAEQAYLDLRASGRDPQRGRRQRRTRPEERLRMMDPW